MRAADHASASTSRGSLSRGPLVELADDAPVDGELTHESVLPTALGGGGALGKLLSKMLQAVRQIRGGGSPGGDAPTHFTRSGVSRGGVRSFTSAPEIAEASERPDQNRGTYYPEWNVHTGSYRQDWCTVLETEPSTLSRLGAFSVPDHSGLRRALARLGLGIGRYGRQPRGDEIDVDALVDARVEIAAGSSPDEAIFVDSQRRQRNLSVLLLLDISGSAAEPAANGQTVHAQQRSAAAALMVALHELGDRVSLYAYHSQGRSSVHVMPVKRFGEHPGALAMERLQALEPGGYSRLGAAIRHGSAVLQRHGGTPRRLLVVLSDGLAYDHGYEPAYGAADARRALGEARNQGVGCLCLSVGASTDVEALRRVFGASAHAALSTPDELKHVIGRLFRSAIRSAELRRRLS
jgi:nitric oxide reductase NorD protein